MKDPNSKLVNIMQACEIVGVSRRTIYNWLGSGKVAFTRTAGGAVRIYRESLFQADPAPVRPPASFL